MLLAVNFISRFGLQISRGILIPQLLATFLLFAPTWLLAQNFIQSNLNFNGFGGVSQGTSIKFGPDDRLYVGQLNGTIDIFTVQRNGPQNYVVVASEELSFVKNIPNHNDDGSSTTTNNREAAGILVVGTPTNPIIYASSSDPRVGGPSGDKNLDTNSGIITRMTWNGSSWSAVDIVRGLPRSEENHATFAIEQVNVNGTNYLLVCSGGHTNAGAPSINFAWTTEYALSAAVLSINLDMINAMPTLTDPSSGRQYIYDIPTLDDPTRPNVNGITDPDDPGYNGIDVGDPWGGNDGLNQAMIVAGGPVQIFTPGYRNTYDFALTESGAFYLTDNGANGGWGGLPQYEGTDSVNNNYITGEPGSSSPSPSGEQVNNVDHLTLVTNDISTYTFGSFYGGHPVPVRANPAGAGLYTNPSNGNTNGAVFRTQVYDPDGSRPNSTTDPNIGLPANWPPVPLSMANPVESDWRAPGGVNPNGPNDVIVTTWGTNTNGLDEYTATNFGGAMKGNLIAGVNGGVLRRVQLNPNGSLLQLTPNFASGLGGNCLGVQCNGDDDIFPGTIWVATFNNNVVILEPQDFLTCIDPSDPAFDPLADYDNDGYTNQDELDNGTDICNAASQPSDHDKAVGAPFVSDLNDPDDDSDGIPDAQDVFQLGDPLDAGTDAFYLPVINELFSDNPQLKGYLGLGFTGLMNNGAPNPNWLNWLDRRDDPNDPNPNDILGGAVGAMTMQMTPGTAKGTANSQEKGFQYGVEVDISTNTFSVEGSLLSFNDPLQLYSNPANGELGIFMGDGTQSNFIQVVLTKNGVEAFQEINDIPQPPLSAVIPVGSRPNASVIFSFNVNAATGDVQITYAFDGGVPVSLGTLAAQGAILTAIQQVNTPLAVGLIGTSNTPGAEVEGTWDYLNVTGNQPYVVQTFPLVSAFVNDPSTAWSLGDYFDDNGGISNLVFTVQSNSNPDIGASISGSQLSLTFPSTAATATLVIRATDADGLFIEQTLEVEVTSEPVVLFRVNAGGPLVTSTDGPNPDWAANSTAGAQTGNGFSVNTGSVSTHNVQGRDASVPAYAPQSLFAQERWDAPAQPEMAWTFNTGNGTFLVNLYMANGCACTSAPGQRMFNILIEGNTVAASKDLSAQYGHQVGAMESYQVQVTDGELNIEFIRMVENPTVNAIEILSIGTATPPVPPIAIDPIANQNLVEGALVNLPVIPSGGDPNENFSFAATGLPPGLQIEPTTGLIFGNIQAGASAASPYASVITVSKPSGTAATLALQWNVSPMLVTNPGSVLYRVNAGGALIPASDAPNPDWGGDTGNFGTAGNSAYLSTLSTGGSVFAQTAGQAYQGPIVMTDPSLPAGTPSQLFQTERYDLGALPNMVWKFPVPTGTEVEVRLYFAEIFSGVSATGDRIFDVAVEGSVPPAFDDIDQYDRNGPLGAFMLSHNVTVSGDTLEIEFFHEIENPAIKAIEILEAQAAPTTTDLTINVSLQSRNDHSGDYRVRLYPSGSTTVAYDTTLTADANGNMTLAGVAAGTYQVAVKFPNSLQTVQTHPVAGPSATISLGELKMGDCNGDNVVSALDFSILATSFNLGFGSPGYQGGADFNGDGLITIQDFSILATNYNTQGAEPSN